MAKKGNRGSFKPGDPRAGRPKGIRNRATADARAVFTQFVESNAGKAQQLWEKVADEDPARALELLGKLAEFVMPKLARSEISGDIGVRGSLTIRD